MYNVILAAPYIQNQFNLNHNYGALVIEATGPVVVVAITSIVAQVVVVAVAALGILLS